MLKWQLMSELLDCSKKMVAMRSSCGTINDARLQCLEALKMAVKLQAPTLYVHIAISYGYYIAWLFVNSVMILKVRSCIQCGFV